MQPERGASLPRLHRNQHGLPADSMLLGNGFDLKSTTRRSRSRWRCLSTAPPQGFRAESHWLQARATEDSRIVLIAESLPRWELLALSGCCDGFLSLHRSEGFGRGMGEARQCGADVIATDFGTNRDFCIGPLAHLVRWRPAPIPCCACPCADGHSWAEPDLEPAAELCRQVA